MVKHWYKSQQCCTFKNRDNITIIWRRKTLYYSMAHEAMCYCVPLFREKSGNTIPLHVRLCTTYTFIRRKDREFYSVAKCSDKA